MSGPRNRVAYEQGQRFREAVRVAMTQARSNLGVWVNITAAHVCAHLPAEFRDRSAWAIRRHMRALRRGVE